LQSIIPAPVAALRSWTIFADTSAMLKTPIVKNF